MDRNMVGGMPAYRFNPDNLYGQFQGPESLRPPPQFVTSPTRAPPPAPPQPPRRTVYDIVETICLYLSGILLLILILELVIQVVMYGYLQTPGGYSIFTGKRLTHYQILGVDPGASQDDITAAWRHISSASHPDVAEAGNNEDTRENYYWIQLAYVELSDPLARCYHDQYHGFISRRYWGEDPCTKILVEKERDPRRPRGTSHVVRNSLLAKVEKDLGIPLSWFKATRNTEDASSGGWARTMGVCWGFLKQHAKHVIAWLLIFVGLVLGWIRRFFYGIDRKDVWRRWFLGIDPRAL